MKRTTSWRKQALCLTIALVIVAWGTGGASPLQTQPQEAFLLDVQGLPLEHKFAAYAAQGLANRDGARVFVKAGADCYWMSFAYDRKSKDGMPIWDQATAAQFRKRYGSVEDYWIEHFQQKGQFKFQPVSLPQLLARLKQQGKLKGLILFDRIEEDCCPAATLAGLEDAVPVTAALRERLRGDGVDLPVVFDYRNVKKAFPANLDRRLEGHRWAITNLLPRVSKTGAVSRARLYNADAHDTIVDIDQAVQNRWFVYDLDHTAVCNNNGAKQDPPDKLLLDQILATIEPFSLVYGWAQAGEESFIRTLNRHRLVGECSGVVNNSFFARGLAGAARFKQKRPHLTPEQVVAHDKVYVAFMVNEGDSIKAANALMCFGSWIQPERGKIPINWGIQPGLLRSHPGLMAYYYQTMTDNDYFFAPPTGWGYTHPSFLPKEALMPYAAKVREGMERADLRYLDVWWAGGIKHEGRLQPFLKAAGVYGMTQCDNKQAVIYPEGGVPVVKSNHYYTYTGSAEPFARRLEADMKDVPLPWFIVVYGAKEHGTPYKFYELAKQLPAGKFKITTLDEFFSAALKAKAKVQGRVWAPGKDAPKGVAP